MVKGSLAILRTGSNTRLAIYRGKYSEYYGNKGAKFTKSFSGEDPLVFSERQPGGAWITRFYFFKNSEIYIEWLT